MVPPDSSPRHFDESPVHGFLGYELVSRSADAAEIRLALREEFLQEEGVIQGGILSSLADATAVYILLPELPADQTMTSIEFKLNFLRPALLGQGDLIARSSLVRRGRTVALCKVEVSQGSKPVAAGLFTYLIGSR